MSSKVLTIQPRDTKQVKLSLVQSARGEVYIMGRVQDPGDPIGSTYDYYIAKFHTDGTLELVHSVPKKLGFTLDSQGCIEISRGGSRR